MGRGRPSKPISQHHLDGTYRKDRHGHRAEPSGDTPICPSDFNGLKRQVWNFLVEEMEKIGRLSSSYTLLMELFCRAYANHRASQKYLDEHGPLVKSAKGETKRNPASIDSIQWLQQVKSINSELGLSPSVVQRITIETKEAGWTTDSAELENDPNWADGKI